MGSACVAVVVPTRPLSTTEVLVIVVNDETQDVNNGTLLMNVTVNVLDAHGFGVLCAMDTATVVGRM